MIKRKISTSIYVVSFILTAGIFFLGLLLGLVVEDNRVDFINDRERAQSLDYNSLQLQYQFINR